MTAIAADAPTLDIAKVIGSTFGVLGRNFLPFLGMTALLVGAPMAIVSLGLLDLIAAPDNMNLGLEAFGTFAIGFLVSIITNALLQGALVYGTVRDLNGARASFGECLAMGLRNLLPVLLLSILMALALIVGFLLLIVPALMMLAAWCVIVPARVSEQTGVIEAFGRSAELTRGNRWRIFALMLLFLVLTWIVGLLLSPLSLAALTAGPQGLVLSQMISNTVSSVINGLIGATGASVIYVELKRLKEGLAPDALAALFD